MTRITTSEVAILARGEDRISRHAFASKLAFLRETLALLTVSHTFSLLCLDATAPHRFCFACNNAHTLTVRNTLSSDDVFLDLVALALQQGLKPCPCAECAG